MKELQHQRYRLGAIKSSLKKFGKSPECKQTLEELEKGISRRKRELYEMEEALPRKNGLYLRIILGNVNVSILNKEDKYE